MFFLSAVCENTGQTSCVIFTTYHSTVCTNVLVINNYKSHDVKLQDFKNVLATCLKSRLPCLFISMVWFLPRVAQSDTQFWYRSDIGQNFRRENKGD